MIELRPYLRNVAAILFVAVSSACHVTKNVSLVENSDATSRPSRIEVTTKSGSTFTIYQPVVRSDSVKGFSDPDRTIPTAVATAEIANAQTREMSGGRTALLVFGIVAAALTALLVVVAMTITAVDY